MNKDQKKNSDASVNLHVFVRKMVPSAMSLERVKPGKNLRHSSSGADQTSLVIDEKAYRISLIHHTK